jgi:threonyl-tRNA synthetase
MAVPVMAVVGGREMRDGRVSLRERDGSQADIPLAEALVPPAGGEPARAPF